MFLSSAVTGKPETKESEVRSHERSKFLSPSLSLARNTEEVADTEDLEAETSPDLIEGDIAISEVSGEIRPRCVYTEF